MSYIVALHKYIGYYYIFIYMTVKIEVEFWIFLYWIHQFLANDFY